MMFHTVERCQKIERLSRYGAAAPWETRNNFRIRLTDQGRNFPLDTVLLLT
jgi:hypothetical protein